MITLSSDVGSKSSVKTFTVPLRADMNADGSLTLGWTEAEHFAALSSNLERPGNDSSDDDASNTSGDDAADDAGAAEDDGTSGSD